MDASDKYEILCPLVPGGAAKSQLAMQKGLAGFRKLVVLRPVPSEHVSKAGADTRFLNQVKVAVGLSHPSIAALYEIEVVGQQLFLVTQFTPGATFDEMLESCEKLRQRVPLGFLLKAVREAAYALHYAHTFADPLGRPRPLVHGALSPHSLLVAYDGMTKLLDFCVPFTGRNDKVRASYAAPEVLKGDDAQVRSDVFSLGAVLHRCLTGRSPSKAELPPTSAKHPEATPQLDAISMRALHPAPENRYASMLEFARELEKLGAGFFYKPEQSAALVQKVFKARLEELRTIVLTEEEKVTTAVMSLGAILQRGGAVPSDDIAAQPTGKALSLREMPAVRAGEEPLESVAPTGEAFRPVLDDLPPTGNVQRLSKEELAAVAAEKGMPIRPRKKGGALRRIAFTLFVLLLAAGGGLYYLAPAFVKGRIAQMRARLGPLPWQKPAPEPPLAEEVSDAGVMLAQALLTDGGAPTEEDAGVAALVPAEGAQADAGTQVSNVKTASKKKKKLRR
ncbi:MAG: serine/threonine protein kinase [Myxococcota bacterium]